MLFRFFIIILQVLVNVVSDIKKYANLHVVPQKVASLIIFLIVWNRKHVTQMIQADP